MKYRVEITRRNFILASGALTLFAPFSLWREVFADSANSGSEDNQPITIQLGQTGESFVLANGQDRVHVKREPAGANFYKTRWSRNQLGVIKVDHSTHSFMIGDVMSCTGIEDMDFPQEGISDFYFNIAIATPEAIPHLEARDRIFKLLHMLQAAGWRRYIEQSAPRLKGVAALEESIRQLGNYRLDPNYLPTLQEWMRLDDGTGWEFCADGIYLTVEFWRDSQRMDPDKPGAYILSFELKTEDVNYRQGLDREERKRWWELWPEYEKSARHDRAEAEAKARAQGLSIDTTYTDPPILALKRHASP